MDNKEGKLVNLSPNESLAQNMFHEWVWVICTRFSDLNLAVRCILQRDSVEEQAWQKFVAGVIGY